MQEFKGTRGPWFSDNTRAIGPISTEDDQSYGMVIPVGWVEFDPEIEVQLANQQLMAAAPELLESLQELFAHYKELADSGDAGNWKLEDEPVGKKAMAAIGKALGK